MKTSTVLVLAIMAGIFASCAKYSTGIPTTLSKTARIRSDLEEGMNIVTF